jgi:hypothetical protein
MSIIELKRPLTRRVGRLVVRIGPEGITLRGYRKRRGIELSWAQVASLSGPERPAMQLAENVDGRRRLADLGAKED